jgi:hypothetical protein
MASTYVHPRLHAAGDMADALLWAASATARAAAKSYRAAHRKHGYAALRPGPETPLWNELVRACERQLKTYGEKARLARILGISRQRLHLLLVSKSACADAERTLQLLAWLRTRQRGSDLL